MYIVIARMKKMKQSLYVTVSLAAMSFRYMSKSSGLFTDADMRRCDVAKGFTG